MKLCLSSLGSVHRKSPFWRMRRVCPRGVATERVERCANLLSGLGTDRTVGTVTRRPRSVDAMFQEAGIHLCSGVTSRRLPLG